VLRIRSRLWNASQLAYGVISGGHACRDCGWHIILDAELYATCPGERG